jgi:hypothetical protein
MLIDPTELAFDYVYNDIVERAVAQLLSRISGLPVTQFGEHAPRPEFDFYLGSTPVELKITSGVYLPVEVAKDLGATIPSGVAISKAPYILYISHGHGAKADGSPPVAKVRMLPRKKLLSDARKTPPSFYTKGGPSQHALVHYLKGPFFTGDIWLGDMSLKQSENGDKWLYDLDSFVPSRKAHSLLNWINQGYIDGDID